MGCGILQEILWTFGNVNLAMVPKETATIESVPSQYEITVFDHDNTLVCRKSYPLYVFWFTKPLFFTNLERQQPLNILLFGPVNSGKSSFVSNCTLAISEVYKSLNLLPFTERVFGFRLQAIRNTPQGVAPIETNVTLWDTMGVHDTSYSEAEFKAIIEGKFQNESTTCAPMHCVIFFMPLSEVSPVPSLVASRTVMFAQIAKHCGIPTVVALTHIVPSDSLSFGGLSDSKVRAAEMFNLHESNVFPLYSYPAIDSERVTEIDKTVLRLLFHAVNQSLTLPPNPPPQSQPLHS